MKYIQLNNLEEAIKDVKKVGRRFDNSAYWEKYYGEKFGRRDTTRERHYAAFLKKLSYKGSKVLDLATGCGFLPLEMHRAGFKVTCLDRYEEMMEMARKYFSKYGVTMKIVKSDVAEIPFKDKSFDLVTAMSIMEHLPIGEVGKSFLPEVNRVVRDEGIVLIHVPVKSALTILKKFVRKNIVRDLPSWAVDDDGDITHTMWLGIDQYADMIEKGGLKIDYIRFNYARSNEYLAWMKLFESWCSSIDGQFFDWKKKLSLRYFLLSKMAVSVAFVCHKVL